MPEKNNDIIYTAADIERYHKGLLSAKEMHALEKAALEDTFLADALEGYAVSGVNTREDITALKNRLANRTEENKVAPVIAQRKSSSFEWWKIAAMILLVAGAGLIVYLFSFNNKSTDIAQTSPVNAGKAETKDSDKITSPALSDTTLNSDYVMPDQPQNSRTKTEITRINPATATKEPTREKDTKLNSLTNDTEASANAPTESSTPANANAERAKEEQLDDATIRQKKVNAARQEEPKAGKQNDEVVPKASRAEQRSVAIPNQVNENVYKTHQSTAFNRTNVFRGRVTDAHNNALPFSNITNTQDNIGTYSDARGYFTLTSPDTVLNVQVSSLGYETNNVKLQNIAPNNQIFLQEDRSSLAEVVISSKKVNSNRSRIANLALEEPEPADGWSNYDIYLANNLKVPEIFKDKQTGTRGEVELAFEIDKNGEPYNIRVKRSLCETCDKEAIRLVKEGPKWKRKAKKGKATVTVSF